MDYNEEEAGRCSKYYMYQVAMDLLNLVQQTGDSSPKYSEVETEHLRLEQLVPRFSDDQGTQLNPDKKEQRS